ncbi:hypothetical protein [Streptomyces sp. NPDC101206]|uniref:zinc finger domain-containing protein n=1 Tax=Streptomyces sp. NPDC101206 TaxID=3366128 RepID=UPI0037F40A26
MTPDQIPQLLKQVSYADPRVLPDDEREVVGLAALWADVLADVPAQFAMRAVGRHYAKSPFPIRPSDIAEQWRAVVHDRMSRHTDTLEPTHHPALDPDDIAGFQATLRAERHAVLMGEIEPTPLKAITAPTPELQARLDRVGGYVPPAVRQQLAAYRPTAAAREQAVAAGRPDPLAVDCPWCAAPTGQHCRTRTHTPGRDPEVGHRGSRAPHPSRIDAATANHTNAA